MTMQDVENNECNINMNADAYSSLYHGFRIKYGMTSIECGCSPSSLSPSGLTGGPIRKQYQLDTPIKSEHDIPSLSFLRRRESIMQQCRMDTPVKPEYDDEGAEYDIPSACHSGPRAGIQSNNKLMLKAFRITAVCMILFTSPIALADDTTETCANGAGTVIVGAGTGHKYCKSNSTGAMTWWNAWSWCDAMNRRLFDRSDCACSNTITDCANNKCPELTGVSSGQRIWTMTLRGTKSAYLVEVPSGNIISHDRNHNHGGYGGVALCY